MYTSPEINITYTWN